MKLYLLIADHPACGAVIEVRGVFEDKERLDTARQTIMDTEPIWIESATEWLDDVNEKYARGWYRSSATIEVDRNRTPEEHCKEYHLLSIEVELNEPIKVEIFAE